MSTIDIARGYADGEVLTEADLDAIKSGLETFFNTTKINDDVIQTSGIDAATKLIDATITTVKIADLAITGAKLADNAVTTAKIAATTVTSDNLATSSIVAAKIAATSLTSANFADLSVIAAKKDALGQQVGSSTGAFAAFGNTEEDVTNATVTITTVGRPVFIGFMPTAAIIASLQSSTSGGNDVNAIWRIYRDSTAVSKVTAFSNILAGAALCPRVRHPHLWYIDQPAAGTYTYKITAENAAAASDQLQVTQFKLFAYEI